MYKPIVGFERNGNEVTIYIHKHKNIIYNLRFSSKELLAFVKVGSNDGFTIKHDKGFLLIE